MGGDLFTESEQHACHYCELCLSYAVLPAVPTDTPYHRGAVGLCVWQGEPMHSVSAGTSWIQIVSCLPPVCVDVLHVPMSHLIPVMAALCEKAYPGYKVEWNNEGY